MDFLSQLINGIDTRVKETLGNGAVLYGIADEVFTADDTGRSLRIFMDDDGQRIAPNNQVEFGGFHVLKSVKPIIEKSGYSLTNPSFDIKLSFILFGKYQKQRRSQVWPVSNLFSQSLSCQKSQSEITLSEINLDKEKIIKSYFPEMREGLVSGQFALDLIEFSYLLKAKNCNCG